MGRRPKQLKPDDPLHAFAIELKTLRDSAGPAGSSKATCAAAGINRTTYYAWLAGRQLPGLDALELTVKAWGASSAYWIERRRHTETALAAVAAERIAKTRTRPAQDARGQETVPIRPQRQLGGLPPPSHDVARGARIDEARELLNRMGFDEQRSNERSAYVLLALMALGPEKPWDQAQMPVLGVRSIMQWISDNYGKFYAANSRESVRALTLRQFLDAGLIVANPDRPNRPVNSARWCFQIKQEHYPLLCSYGREDFDQLVREFKMLK